MKTLKKYSLIAIGLIMLFILSTISQKDNGGKINSPCCPFSIKQSNNNLNGVGQ
jgi:hypothetical protein